MALDMKVPECPWCKAGPDNDGTHAADCELVAAREAVAALESSPPSLPTSALSAEHIQRLQVVARMIRRCAASGDMAPVLDADADAIDAALAAVGVPHGS